MGIKHLSKIETILTSADEPITAWKIQKRYAEVHGHALHLSILVEALLYLMKENKVKASEIDSNFGKSRCYKWVG